MVDSLLCGNAGFISSKVAVFPVLEAPHTHTHTLLWWNEAPQSHTKDGLLVPNSILVVSVEPPVVFLNLEPLHSTMSVHTVDDINLHYFMGPKLWELWYIPYCYYCKIYIINRRPVET